MAELFHLNLCQQACRKVSAARDVSQPGLPVDTAALSAWTARRDATGLQAMHHVITIIHFSNEINAFYFVIRLADTLLRIEKCITSVLPVLEWLLMPDTRATDDLPGADDSSECHE